MKPVLTLCILFLSLLSLSASPIDEATARAYAAAWWNKQNSPQSLTKSAPLRLAKHLPRAFVFERGNHFLLLATDDSEPLVLGYGEGSASAEMPAPLRAVLQKAQTAAYSGTNSYPVSGAKWEPVAPLLTTLRHQDAPYNAACPFYTRDDGSTSSERCKVGCVATAMEQILTYYKRVYTLCDTLHGWQTDHYIIPDVLPGATVDSRLIRDDYADSLATDNELDAVARLSYYLGVACKMDWGLESSGAYSSRLAEPLQRVFALKYVHYLDSYQYRPADYWNFLAHEIAARRPVYYAGSVMETGGHAFVLDGLDENGLFHVNWGMEGDYNGYYRLDILFYPQPESDRTGNAAVGQGFFCNQEAIAVCPDSVPDAVMPDTLTRTGQEIEVENVLFNASPETGCYTPVRLCVRNVTADSLTTPFALMQGGISDTLRIQQADCIGMTGCTLAPAERDTLWVDTRFTRSGELLFFITPDGEQIIDSLVVNVGDGGTDDIATDQAPQLTFPAPGKVSLAQTYRNPSTTERAAEKFHYDLLDETTQTARTILHILYLSPNEIRTDTASFSSLQAGHTYTLRLRKNWPIVQSVQFTLPPIEAISEAEATPLRNNAPATWFTPDGRRITHPAQSGIYLRRKGNKVQKLWIK